MPRATCADAMPIPTDDIEALEARLQRHGRGRGAVFTPWPIVRRAVETALAPLCHNREPPDLLKLRVLDPAVGSGRFLVAAIEFLAARCERGPGQLARRLATECLFGADVDRASVELARARLAQATGCQPGELAGHLAVGDSLVADLRETLGADGFDAVVTNPPWQSFSGRQAARLSKARRERLARRYESFTRWPTSHGAFLELSARLLRPGGRAALVVPAQLCHLPGYEACRRAVTRLCRFEPQPCFLGEDAFSGVVQPAAIVFLHKPLETRSERAPVALRRSRRPEADIIRSLERHPPAPSGSFGDVGVHTGNSARLVLHERPAPGLEPIREGKCVHPFALEPPALWLDPDPDLPEGRYCKVRPAALYRRATVVLRQTADRPVATRHLEPTYFRNSVIGCFGLDGLADAALVGVLNSAPAAFYHKSRHADSRQRAFPQVKVSHLQTLPIPGEAGALAPLARRLEELASERLRRELWLAERLATALGEEPLALWRRLRRSLATPRHGWSEALVGAAEAVSRHASAGKAALAEKAAAKAVEGVEALENQWRTARRQLDQLACRLYGLAPGQAAVVLGQA